MTDKTGDVLNLPDHPIRKTSAYQLFHRLPSGLLKWAGVMGAGWAMFFSDIVGTPMDYGNRIIVLVFVGALYGIDAGKKLKGFR